MAIIDKPSDFFNTVLYTGNGGTLTVSGVGFQSNFTWLKGRSFADYHVLTDSVRGVNSQVYSNDAGSQGSQTNGITSFNSDGFVLGNWSNTNKASNTHVGWNWKAGTSFSNSAGANGASIASTGSINTAAGFSVVKWTGSGSNATIGHGLGTKPSMLMVKNTTATGGWRVWHQNLTSTQTLQLNTTAAVNTSAGQFNSSATFNSTVFSVGGEGDTNESGSTIIAYCFADKQGYSKFGKYSANANVDGTFVYTGFKPTFILIKASNSAQDGQSWFIYDSSRDSGNTATQTLQPNTNAAEQTNVAPIDILSNGFKLRTNTGRINGTNGEYIYMAFGQSIVGTNNIPATAF